MEASSNGSQRSRERPEPEGLTALKEHFRGTEWQSYQEAVGAYLNRLFWDFLRLDPRDQVALASYQGQMRVLAKLVSEQFKLQLLTERGGMVDTGPRGDAGYMDEEPQGGEG